MQNFCISHEEAPRKVKTLRKQCAAAILTLMLAVSTYAGQIDCPGAVTNTTTTLITDVVTAVVVTVASSIP